MHILSIKPETFLYFYMASCISVLIFNLLYMLADKLQGRRMEKHSMGMVGMIRSQMEKLENGQPLDEAHINFLKRKLKRLSNLRTFENSMNEVGKSVSREKCLAYSKKLIGVFRALSPVYEKKDVIEQAYYAKLIEILEIDKGAAATDELMECLIRMTISKSVYVRENALKALYTIGNKEAILAAFIQMEDYAVYHSVKLLADGLLLFTGDKEELAKILFKHSQQFDVSLNLAVMQYIRFCSGNFQQEFLKLLQKDTADKEIILEAIRYFRKYPYEPAREDILKYLRFREVVSWEYAALAAAALASYPGAETIRYLKEGLKATNWYVRYNCAEALIVGLKIPRVELFDVYNANDRYAREILQYAAERLDIKKQKREWESEDV